MKQILHAAALTTLLAASACVTVVNSAPSHWDAVAAAPASHVVLLENEDVRVLRVTIPPGATEPVHEHQWPSVMYFEQPQPITYVVYDETASGAVETDRIEAPALPAGEVVWAEPEGLHAVQNRGTEPFVALRVEYKRSPP